MNKMVSEPPMRPLFTQDEIDAVHGRTPAGLHGLIPARCYADPDVYAFEVEHILKRRWLAVGRWDWAEKPGDYFTLTMFGEPLVIVRDRTHALHCLVNACRHRWAQVVEEGSGNKAALVCPYHRWSYHLDGTLRAVSVEKIDGLDPADCALRRIRLEVWEGTIFLNFDADADALAPQLAGLAPYLERFEIGKMRTAGRTSYETSWNYKFSFETGYEAYHHAGIHRERIIKYAPPEVHEPIAYGDIWGLYGGRLPQEFDRPDFRLPLGRPPWMSEEEYGRKGEFRSLFAAVYPGLITYISPYQISMITTEHLGMDRNLASTHISIAPWALENAENAAAVERLVDGMQGVQSEDSFGCKALQKGVVSGYNDFSVIHPKYEPQLIHYHKWMLNEYMTA